MISFCRSGHPRVSPAMRLSRGVGQEAMTGLSLAAAAPGHARWPARVVPAAEGPGESSPAMSAAAAVMPPRPVPGPGRGDRRDAGAGLSVCHPPGDTESIISY